METPGHGSGCRRMPWLVWEGGAWLNIAVSPPSLRGSEQNSKELTAKRVLQEHGEKGQMGTGGPGGTLSPSSRNRSPERGAGDGRAAGMAFHTPPSPAQIPIPISLGYYPLAPASPVLPVSSWGVGLGGTLYPKYPALPLFWQNPLKSH